MLISQLQTRCLMHTRWCAGDFAKSIRSRSDLRLGLYHALDEFFNPLFLADRASVYKTRRFPKVGLAIHTSPFSHLTIENEIDIDNRSVYTVEVQLYTGLDTLRSIDFYFIILHDELTRTSCA